MLSTVNKSPENHRASLFEFLSKFVLSNVLKALREKIWPFVRFHRSERWNRLDPKVKHECKPAADTLEPRALQLPA